MIRNAHSRARALLKHERVRLCVCVACGCLALFMSLLGTVGSALLEAERKRQCNSISIFSSGLRLNSI